MKHVIDNTTLAQQSVTEKAADVALAMFIGFCLAMALVSWWTT